MSTLSTKGYLAFPPISHSANTTPQSLKVPESNGTCATQNSHHACHDPRQPGDDGKADQALAGEIQKRRERERILGEHSEIEWVRAGGILRDAFGRRDKARTERIRQELRVQDVEKERIARWEVYETRWRAMQSSRTPIAFVEFPWPLGERVPGRDVSGLARSAVAEFLFETLTVRTNTTTKRERIRSSLLRWHPDKTLFVLNRVVPDDLELVREGICVIFGILKALQDAERMGTL